MVDKKSENRNLLENLVCGESKRECTTPNLQPIALANEYQKLALRTARPNADLIECALGLTGESGEFADLLKKSLCQGHEFDKTEAVKELGDILWYIATAASLLGVPLSEVMATNIEKLKKRYPQGFEESCSVNRKED